MDDGEFRVYHRTWDDRYFLMNIDGAHHIAAIYRQCIEQKRDFQIEVYPERHSPNQVVCQRILDNSRLLLLSKSCASKLIPIRVDFGYFPSPSRCEYEYEKTLLYLNRNFQKTEMMYQAITKTLPQSCFVDVSKWLAHALAT